jgi:hypothetical protein
MDFGFFLYMGVMTLCLICVPPTLTIIGTAAVLALRMAKVIQISNRQVIIIGGVLLFLACVLTWLFVELATNGVYAM